MSVRELNKKAEKIGFLSSRKANHTKCFNVISMSKGEPKTNEALEEKCTEEYLNCANCYKFKYCNSKSKVGW